MNIIYRKAVLQDVDQLEQLIGISARSINSSYYTKDEINAALGNAWTVDQQLILDNTYWVAENTRGDLVGCGGWSKRKLLFGKNKNPDFTQKELNPGKDSARIRAFFVHPDYTRKGIGRRLLQLCESEAKSNGFTSTELLATLSGEKLYSSCGYVALTSYEVDLGRGITNQVISMHKSLE